MKFPFFFYKTSTYVRAKIFPYPHFYEPPPHPYFSLFKILTIYFSVGLTLTYLICFFFTKTTARKIVQYAVVDEVNQS